MEADVYSCGVIMYALLSGGRCALLRLSCRPAHTTLPWIGFCRRAAMCGTPGASQPPGCVVSGSHACGMASRPVSHCTDPPCRFPFKRAGEEDAMSTGLQISREKWRAVAGHIAPLPQVQPKSISHLALPLSQLIVCSSTWMRNGNQYVLPDPLATLACIPPTPCAKPDLPLAVC